MRIPKIPACLAYGWVRGERCNCCCSLKEAVLRGTRSGKNKISNTISDRRCPLGQIRVLVIETRLRNQNVTRTRLDRHSSRSTVLRLDSHFPARCCGCDESRVAVERLISAKRSCCDCSRAVAFCAQRHSNCNSRFRCSLDLDSKSHFDFVTTRLVCSRTRLSTLQFAPPPFRTRPESCSVEFCSCLFCLSSVSSSFCSFDC